MKKILLTFVLLLAFFIAEGQTKGLILKARIVGLDNVPVEGAVVSVAGNQNAVLSGPDGLFSIEIANERTILGVRCEGYYSYEIPVGPDKNLSSKLVLVPLNLKKYSEDLVLPYGVENCLNSVNSAYGIEKKDMKQTLTLDRALQGAVPGLRVIQKSGMPGEGSYLNLGGMHSLTSQNEPLLVVNGVPSMNRDRVSNVINGYSRSLFSGINISDIKSVTVLQGAATSLYGSLGSNGVLLVETEQSKSNIMETRISFSGQYGMSLKGKSIPVLNRSEYANYLREIGMTRYNQMSPLYADYPFLQNDKDYKYNYLFNNNTDWQSEIYRPAFSSNSVFRVEGGDEIAKYNISVGYTSDGGTLKNTRTERYNTLINSNILVSRKVDIFTTVGLAYNKSDLQEQGMLEETNPMLTATLAMPQLNPYKADEDGNLTPNYATYDLSNVNSNPTFAYENVSNSLAIVNMLKATDKIYHVNVKLGLNYNMTKDLKMTGLFNTNYRYLEENIFIPGVTNKVLLPQYWGIGKNTVRKGIEKSQSRYLGLNLAYNHTFENIHEVSALAGSRIVTDQDEYDVATGYNTANDFYQTLGYTTDEETINGFNNDWVWVNHFMHLDYTYNRLVKASLNASVDGTSVSGIDAPRFFLFPSVGLTYMAANTGALPEFINILNFRGSYGLTGNSRYSSNFAKNYYLNSNYFTFGTITRSNVPSTDLEPEKTKKLDVGFELSALNRRMNFSLNYFNADAYDLLIAKNISAVYGSNIYYDNAAEITTQGLELSLRADLVQSRTFAWSVGGNVSSAKSKVLNLGNRDRMTLSFTGYNNKDDVQVLLVKGEAPYQFYGFKTNGIYATEAEAQDDALTSIYGTSFHAGDVRFVDQTVDKVLTEKDKVLLGSAAPEYFGSLFTSIRYHSFSLTADFNYSVGNKAYNAVRRKLESMETFHNQTKSVLRHWQVEGQQTDLPRAVYGDPSGNAAFSDRWIEDASYIKLSNLCLSYNFNKSILRLFRSGSLWLCCENLFTLTNYLGADPEFSYSFSEAMQGFDYGKTPLPKTLKIGFDLNF